MSKFTPGNWKAHERMPECVTFIGKDGEENLFTQNPKGYFCCRSPEDASLIAASKDMHEALRLARVGIYQERNGAFACIGCGAINAEEHAPDCCFRDIDSALAKARGES